MPKSFLRVVVVLNDKIFGFKAQGTLEALLPRQIDYNALNFAIELAPSLEIHLEKAMRQGIPQLTRHAAALKSLGIHLSAQGSRISGRCGSNSTCTATRCPSSPLASNYLDFIAVRPSENRLAFLGTVPAFFRTEVINA